MFVAIPRSMLPLGSSRVCMVATVWNRAAAACMAAAGTPCLPNGHSVPCREYHEVTGNIICPSMVMGIDHLRDPRLNKGLAFTLEERQALGIHGLQPARFKSQEEQLEICRISLERYKDNLNKYLYLVELQDRNERLYFRLLSENVTTLLPIVYTPTVGLACQKFGLIYRRPRGLFITVNDKGHIYDVLKNWPEPDVRVIVVTDGERILGLGDLGACGMGIPVGKLALYTALAGVKPHQCLPITLDVGTNNQSLLEDPLYIGLRQTRSTGEEYDTFLEEFMYSVIRRYGQNTLIQFEDFALHNAFKLLQKFRHQYCTFNDDIQGTAAVVVAGLYASSRITKRKLHENIFVFAGAGGASTGIANFTVAAMVNEGVSEEQARARIFMVDVQGLLVSSRSENLGPADVFKKDLPAEKDLLAIVKKVKPSVLIGASTVGGLFTPEILQEVAKISDRPIIFALSNPTDKAECTAEAAYVNTEGRCVFSSGSPFDPVTVNGKTFHPGQGNNAYIFPGVGLGVITSAAHHISDVMFLKAAMTLAECVSEEDLDMGSLYPPLDIIKDISLKIAVEVAKCAYDEGVASMYPQPKKLEEFITKEVYDYNYEGSMPITWPWKPEQEFNIRPITPITKNI